MPEAILQVLLDLLSLDPSEYWNEVREWERRDSIHHRLAEETRRRLGGTE